MQDRLSASIVTQIDDMPQKTETVKTRVPPDLRASLEGVAEEAGLTTSGLLRLLIENVTEDADTPSAPPRLASRARLDGKVTVRLAEDVRAKLETEARGQGVAVSTWAATLLSARLRQAPQAVGRERRGIQRAFRQLRGLAVNVNQIAYALNRGVLTGAGADLTHAEVAALRDEVAVLRKALSAYAGGRFRFQTSRAEQEATDE